VSEQKGDTAMNTPWNGPKRPLFDHLLAALRASWAILEGGDLSGLFLDLESTTSCSLT
jgi:hypothetical protein